ncbi:hypothetical protein GCM10010503_42660 [Streptomyces lucensis JCM 4490]|uniref:Uncharacterized protein n=1 Tax=Streptomyces lucensis JCM 4490 TaxID=1306176 RepID=A0A918MTT6_9ACTN|nr:hypothetical protein GCM10010503_42660 [Streptomyces lucensis JCM 4490]
MRARVTFPEAFRGLGHICPDKPEEAWVTKPLRREWPGSHKSAAKREAWVTLRGRGGDMGHRRNVRYYSD